MYYQRHGARGIKEKVSITIITYQPTKPLILTVFLIQVGTYTSLSFFSSIWLNLIIKKGSWKYSHNHIVKFVMFTSATRCPRASQNKSGYRTTFTLATHASLFTPSPRYKKKIQVLEAHSLELRSKMFPVNGVHIMYTVKGVSSFPLRAIQWPDHCICLRTLHIHTCIKVSACIHPQFFWLFNDEKISLNHHCVQARSKENSLTRGNLTDCQVKASGSKIRTTCIPFSLSPH